MVRVVRAIREIGVRREKLEKLLHVTSALVVRPGLLLLLDQVDDDVGRTRGRRSAELAFGRTNQQLGGSLTCDAFSVNCSSSVMPEKLQDLRFVSHWEAVGEGRIRRIG